MNGEQNENISVHGGVVNESIKEGAAVEESLTEFTSTADDRDGMTSAERARNAEAAERRRETQRQKELRAERVKTTLEMLDHTNPYTQEQMTDEVDVAEYEAMREAEKSGKDPVDTLRKQRKEKDRERIAEAAKESEREAFYANDRKAFETAHPDVKIQELAKDEKFLIFSDGKIGRMPLSKIYEDYARLMGQIKGEKKEASARQIAAQMVANRNASPGSLSDAAETAGIFFTRDQVKAMSQAEVKRNYEAIRESMKKW